ncbi:MAG: glycosyltransferase family 4 protein [Planctomycetota bacterium]|jgi:glycosyltransferase involved in cell wall biosynthesis
MRIGIDVSILAESERTGVENYCHELVCALGELHTPHEFHLFSYKTLHRKLGFPKTLKLHEGRASGRLAPWRELHLPAKISKERIDVFHSPVLALPIRAGVKKVATVHELTWLSAPEHQSGLSAVPHRARLAYAARGADALIAVSHDTKNAIAQVYPEVAERTAVIPHGVSKAFGRIKPRELNIRLSHYGLRDSPYILCVSRLDGKKNLRLLAETYDRVRSELPHGTRLVIAGKPGDLDRRDIDRLEQINGVNLTGYIPEVDLVALMNGALMLVHPAAHEGFGLPPLEAMACGIPVIAADRGGITETLEDAARLFDPDNEDEFAATMIFIATDEEYREELIRRGYLKAAEFTWPRAAAKTLEVFEAVGKLP